MTPTAKEPFFEKPILNSPYEYPSRHWELDGDGQPTNQIISQRRSAEFKTPIPKPKKRRQSQEVQQSLPLYDTAGISTDSQKYSLSIFINSIRSKVEQWRVMSELMGLKNILVLNDEAHHCYREKPDGDDLDDLKGEDKDEAKKNNEMARLWISGIEMVKRKLGLLQVYDLSATPFFLRGSGYAEGTLFPWTVSDFSLMDAIECGIVKLPRVPVADNVPGADMPKLRNLWSHIRTKMPKKGRSAAKDLDPLDLPSELLTALDALYGHYAKTYELWQEQGISVPPVFIVVCNNTSTSKLVYDYIAGFHRERSDDSKPFHAGRLELFRNYDDYGERLARPRTLLIDSEQLESGEALDSNFRKMASDEIESEFNKLITSLISNSA